MKKKEYTAPQVECTMFQLEQGFAATAVPVEDSNFEYRVEDDGKGW